MVAGHFHDIKQEGCFSVKSGLFMSSNPAVQIDGADFQAEKVELL
jgi:hypothetical protein